MVKGQAFEANYLIDLHNLELLFEPLVGPSCRGQPTVSIRATYHLGWGYVFYGMIS
jgi:hypothetical protein